DLDRHMLADAADVIVIEPCILVFRGDGISGGRHVKRFAVWLRQEAAGRERVVGRVDLALWPDHAELVGVAHPRAKLHAAVPTSVLAADLELQVEVPVRLLAAQEGMRLSARRNRPDNGPTFHLPEPVEALPSDQVLSVEERVLGRSNGRFCGTGGR